MNQWWRGWSLRARLAIILVILAVCTNFAWISYPPSVVFDEVHFGKFVTAYCCTKERFFDIHPPHAKLAIAAVVSLFSDYDGSMKFESIGESYGDQSILAFRFVPALLGSLIPLVAFFLVLQLHGSLAAAFLAGFALCLDNGLKVQSRVISLDGMLVLSILLALLFAFKATRLQSRLHARMFTGLAGVAAGFAVGTKVTGLVAWSVPLFWILFGSLPAFNREYLFARARLALWFVTAGVLVYLTGWVIHFSILTNPGSGDQFYRPVGSFFRDAYHMQRVMIEANVNLLKGHPYSSMWWSWPFMTRGVFYWSAEDAVIYFLGNPVVWIGASFLILLAIFSNLIRDVKALYHRTLQWSLVAGFWFMVIAYLNAYLPYIKVTRALFLYHYLPPLVFAVIGSALFLDQWSWFRNTGFEKNSGRYYACLAAITLGYIALVPLTYGVPLSAYNQFVFSILPSWR